MVTLSSSATAVLAAVLVAYVVALFLLSIYATRKIENEEDYLVAGRRLPLFLTWGTLLATWFGAATMLGAAQAARDEGVRGTVLDPFACAATLVLAGLFFAGPLWRMKLLTMGDFYRRTYGTRAEILSCTIQVPSYFGWIAAQYIALGSIQEVYFGIPLTYGILISAGITLAYTMIGGMWSVTLTDTAQIVVALLGLIVLADATFSTVGEGSFLAGLNRLLEETPPDQLTLLPTAGTAAMLAWIGTWATGLFGNIPGQDLNQRVFSAKSESVAKSACIVAGVLYLVFGLIPVSLGLISRITDPGEVEGKILPLLAGRYLTPTMAIVFVVSLVSIIVSTATSAVLAPATILAHNLLGRVDAFKGHNLLLDRLSVLLISLGALAVAFSGETIMGLLDVSLSIALSALFVPLAMGIYGRPRGELPALLAMSLGFGFWLVRFLLENVIAPIPDSLAESGLSYSDYVAQALGTRPGADILSQLAAIPEDIYGLAASVFGYFLGQWLSRGTASSQSTNAPI